MAAMGSIQEHRAPARKEEEGQLRVRNRTWQQEDAEHSTEVLCKGKDPDRLPGEQLGPANLRQSPRSEHAPEASLPLQGSQEQARRAAGRGACGLHRAC